MRVRIRHAGIAVGAVSLSMCLFAVKGPAAGPPQTKSASAKTLYERHCIRCHDTDGRGREMRLSTPEIPDFTNRTWQARHDNVHLRISILDGRGTYMPGFAEKITERQARELVDFLRTFANGTANDVSLAINDFERRFREYQQQLEELQKQYRALSSSTTKTTTERGTR